MDDGLVVRMPRAAASAAATRPGARKQKLPLPWRDRGGRFSWFKATALLLVLLPGIWNAWAWSIGGLGPHGRMEAIHQCGLWAIRLLLITLAVSPLARLARWQRVMTLRRMLGLAALAYVLAHFSLYIVDEKFNLLVVASEIVKRFYLTLGFIAIVGLVVLGWTSTDGAMRRMGRRWKKLHRLLYLLVPLGVVHYFMQSKADVSEATIVAGCFFWLMLWRALPGRWRDSLPAVLAIGIVATLGTAAAEYTWYALETRIRPMRVLLANFDVSYTIRPAVWIAMASLAILLAVAVRQAVAAILVRRAA
jgi:sulfoxide reductase heme-binding subunit YedZ